MSPTVSMHNARLSRRRAAGASRQGWCWPFSGQVATESAKNKANTLRYAKEFLDLQLEFAETVSALSGLPLARTVLDYTNFYARFGLGREFYDFYGV
jgi:hypothetical protein